jgi:hypothetical protein
MTLFENLELTNQDDNRERRQAASLSQTRAKARFANFLAPAEKEEWEARFALVADDFRNMVAQTCSEVGYNDPAEIFTVVAENMRTAFDTDPTTPQGPDQVRLKHYPARGKPGSYNEQCQFTGKRPQAGEDWGMVIFPGGGFKYADPAHVLKNHPEVVDIGHGVTGAAINDGDTYTQDHIDLPSSESGDFGDTVTVMDKSLADNEPFIEVPSAEHPTEHQGIDDVGDLASDFNPKDLGLIDTIDIEKPLQPELTKGETGVFPAGNMAAPVTSAQAHDPYGFEIQNYDPTEATPGEYQRGDMVTHPAAEELAGRDYTPGSIQGWASQLDQMGLSPEDAWKAITDHFQRKTEDAHNAADAPEEPMGLSDEDLSAMHVQGDKADPSVEDLPEDERTSKWRLI